MAVIKSTYKTYNGSSWDEVYFDTSYDQVGVVRGKIDFFYHEQQTINGKKFDWDSTNAVYKPIVLTANDINAGDGSHAQNLAEFVSYITEELNSLSAGISERTAQQIRYTTAGDSFTIYEYVEGIKENVENNYSEITKIKDGTTIVKKAEQDENGNNIYTYYAPYWEVNYIKDGTTIIGAARLDGERNDIVNTYLKKIHAESDYLKKSDAASLYATAEGLTTLQSIVNSRNGSNLYIDSDNDKTIKEYIDNQKEYADENAYTQAQNALTDAKAYTDEMYDKLLGGDLDAAKDSLFELLSIIENDETGLAALMADIETNRQSILDNQGSINGHTVEINSLSARVTSNDEDIAELYGYAEGIQTELLTIVNAYQSYNTKIDNHIAETKRHRQIFMGSTTPTGMATGDIWIQY